MKIIPLMSEPEKYGTLTIRNCLSPFVTASRYSSLPVDDRQVAEAHAITNQDQTHPAAQLRRRH